MSHAHAAKSVRPAKGGALKGAPLALGGKVLMDEAGLEALLDLLLKVGYQPIGPKARDGAIVYDEIFSISDLPIGFADEQEGGKYRLVPGTRGSFFEYLVGPSSWKRFLFPPRQTLWTAERKGKGFAVAKTKGEAPAYAFIGVRPCELNAMKIQDKVFGFGRKAEPSKGVFSDPDYVARRSKALIIAVNCSRAGKTCFCTSMDGDPHVVKDQGFDLALTELTPDRQHEFVVEVGSERGRLILELLPYRPVQSSHLEAEKDQARRARSQVGRKMPADIKTVLKRNLEHKRWEDVAARCLSCGNCTMVCPTCFCTTVEDGTDLKGAKTQRARLWDSCFSSEFSYIHGGAVRKGTKARYRQWMTHKLSNWHEQFGTSGCVGCGRCIAWCPVGIDITEEARIIRNTGK